MRGKTWDFTPKDCLRVSDHWNFLSGGRLHCVTHRPVPAGGWTLARFVGGTWEVLATYPRASPAERDAIAAGVTEALAASRGHWDSRSRQAVLALATGACGRQWDRLAVAAFGIGGQSLGMHAATGLSRRLRAAWSSGMPGLRPEREARGVVLARRRLALIDADFPAMPPEARDHLPATAMRVPWAWDRPMLRAAVRRAAVEVEVSAALATRGSGRSPDPRSVRTSIESRAHYPEASWRGTAPRA